MQEKVLWTVLIFIISKTGAPIGQGDYNMTNLVCKNDRSPLLTLDTTFRVEFGFLHRRMIQILWINRIKYLSGADCKRGTSERSYVAPVVVSLALIGGVAAFLGYILYKRFKQKQNIYWEARSPGNDEEHKYAVPTPYNNTDGPMVPENSAYYYNDTSTDHVQYVNLENKKKERDRIYANNSKDSSENADASSPLEVYESVT